MGLRSMTAPIMDLLMAPKPFGGAKRSVLDAFSMFHKAVQATTIAADCIWQRWASI